MRCASRAALLLAVAAAVGCEKTTTMSVGSSSAGTSPAPRPAGGGGVEPVKVSLTPAVRSVKVAEEETRRGIEPEYINSQRFGAPRGREFQDIIPVGARLTAVHICGDAQINGIWLDYEIGGKAGTTPCRGIRRGKEHTLVLDKREKIVGIHGYGAGGIDLLVIATNQRVVTLGNTAAAPAGSTPSCTLLNDIDRRRLVAVGILGRADDRLRQLVLRLQVRGKVSG